MTQPNNDDAHPDSNDIEGWLLAAKEDRIRTIPLGAIVAAIQDLGVNSDVELINSLAAILSIRTLALLRGLVRKSYPNSGEDIVLDAHNKIIKSVFLPSSPDGKALRLYFGKKLKERLADSIRSFRREEKKRDKAIEEAKAEGEAYDMSSQEHSESLYVEEVLELVKDDRKRLAFRLYMDDVPVKSKDGDSICKALGKSDKTIRAWIEEVQNQLKTIVEKQL